MIDSRNQILFHPENCIGCKLCYKACFVDVIRWDEEKKQPVIRYPEDCAHCFWCEAICKKGCIEVIPDYAGDRLLQTFDCYQ